MNEIKDAENETLTAAAAEFERLQKIVEEWGNKNEYVKNGEVVMPPEGSAARLAIDEMTAFAQRLYGSKAAHTLLGFWRTQREAEHLKKCQHCKEQEEQMKAAQLMKGRYWKN